MEEFITDLQKLAKDCEFKEENEMTLQKHAWNDPAMQGNRTQTKPRQVRNQAKGDKILWHHLWARRSPPRSRQGLSVTTDESAI